MNKYYTKDGVIESYERSFYDILHRLDGPAVECENGDKFWYQNNKLHRLDGPAVEFATGDKQWWKNNKLHRLDGPAVEWATFSEEWWVNGEIHRLDGPAIIYADGKKEWWVDNKNYTIISYYKQKEVIEYLKLNSLIISADIKNLIQEYKNTSSNDIFAVIQDYFLENNLLTNSSHSDIILDVITYYNFK